MSYSAHARLNTWCVSVDGKYIGVIKNYLEEDGIPSEGVDKIVQNAATTLSYCPNPSADSICQKTGIVIGKVQSGKTSNFISISALAFDNGYDTIVILGGTKKPLVKQNRDRISDYFAKARDVIVLDTNDYKTELTAAKIQQFIRMGKKVIIVALKSPAQLTFIKDSVFPETSSLADKATLIIDDEGDEASLNTLVKKGNKSSTYLAIESLKSRLTKHCFLSVTATPQANLLINTLDILSPDFGVLVDPGEGYCGLNVFHSDGRFVEKIPDNETSLLDSGIPPSFIKAISMFFVACAIQQSRGMKPGEKLSMLVHPSQRRADHEKVYKKVCNLINDWSQRSANKNDIAYSSLKTILLSAYQEYEKSIPSLPPFDAIEDSIIAAINFCGKFKVNGDSVSTSADNLYDFNIYIGGTMLGRGLTLKGLTITYIIRTSKGTSAADTVQQRARWFGYKRKYLDLCRVFAVGKIIREFSEIRDHEEDLWETVRFSNMQGTEFKNMARIFALSDNLRMTRTSVAKTNKFTFKFWNKQREFQSDPDYINNNKLIIAEFRMEHESSIQSVQFGRGTPFSILFGVDFQTVKEQLLDRFVFPDNSDLNTGIISKLAALIKTKHLSPTVDVIWMRDGETSKHSVENGHIGNYSVGRRPQDTSKPIVYAGDDYQFVKPDVMQLQIHTIEDTNTGIISPTLALYLPVSVVSKLTNLVIQA